MIRWIKLKTYFAALKRLKTKSHYHSLSENKNTSVNVTESIV